MANFKKPCPTCKNNVLIESQYCSFCGHQFLVNGVRREISIPDRRFRGYLVADIELCIGAETENYLEKFRHSKYGSDRAVCNIVFISHYMLCDIWVHWKPALLAAY